MLTFMEKKGFADVIKLRLLRWGDCPGLSVWALNTITCIIIRGMSRQSECRLEKNFQTQYFRREFLENRSGNNEGAASTVDWGAVRTATASLLKGEQKLSLG